MALLMPQTDLRDTDHIMHDLELEQPNQGWCSWTGLDIRRYEYLVCVSPKYGELVHCLQLAPGLSFAWLEKNEGGARLKPMWWAARFSEDGWCSMPTEPIRLSDSGNPLSFTTDGHPLFTWQNRQWHLTEQIGDDVRHMLAQKCPNIRHLGVV